ncbi:MAG TPA: T9SS type A sorting domain-containing protein [Flavisolibacter sp.]|nr:T9SS type A sorting domain-containing protein [Flavisolibacter sp.]
MKHHQLVSKMLMICLLFCAFRQSASAQTINQVPVYTRVNSFIGGYYEALPVNYASNPTAKFPVLIFLHGAGEVGDGSPAKLPLVLRNAIPKLIKENKFPTSFNVNGQSHSFIVISPQMSGSDYSGNSIHTLIDHLISKYRVDQSRIYLTGLSMGGGNTWVYAGSAAGSTRLAGIVNICGNSPAYDGMVNTVAKANLPVWAFHNQGDGVCPVAYTNDWIRKLNAYVPAMSPSAKGTIFPVSGHDAWTKAYDPNYRENNMNVYEWMLQYSRGTAAPAPPPNQAPVVNAGTDKTITLPVSSIAMTASASDADGSIASYAWTKLSGPTSFAFSSASVLNPTISTLVQGSYVFRLTVTDNAGATRSDDVTVVVNAAIVVTPPPAPAPPPPAAITKYVKVNVFGGSNPSTSTEWNNWNTNTSLSSSALTYSDGSSSTVRAALSQQTGVGDNGTGYNTTMCPAAVGRYASYSTGTRELVISGLDNNKTYSLELYASRNGATNNTTRYTLGTAISIKTDNNLANKASYTGIKPVDGKIKVMIEKLTNYNYLNGFTLTESTTTVAAKSSLAQTEVPQDIQVMPNPVENKFFLKINNQYKGQIQVKITSLSGAEVKNFSLNKPSAGWYQVYLSIDGLTAGEYVLTAGMGDQVQSVKLIKK